MKTLIVGVTLGVALAGFSPSVLAGCSTGRVNEPALTTLLKDNTVCVPPVTVPTMEAQELHQSGGKLIDYKRGPKTPTNLVDFSTEVGTWTVTGSNRGAFVTHNYGNGRIYTYSVYNNGDGTHSFCSGGAEIKAKIKLGGGAC